MSIPIDEIYISFQAKRETDSWKMKEIELSLCSSYAILLCSAKFPKIYKK